MFGSALWEVGFGDAGSRRSIGMVIERNECHEDVEREDENANAVHCAGVEEEGSVVTGR